MTESETKIETAETKATDGDGETAARKKPARSLGRPRIETVRDHYITVRVTAMEHLKVMRKASASGISVTDYARDRILRGIARKKKQSGSVAEEMWIDDVTPLVRGAVKLWHELHKATINLNQIAHHCNRHQEPPPASFPGLLADLRSLLDRLMRP
jgi:predicted HicB family RNase H-like nuclease